MLQPGIEPGPCAWQAQILPLDHCSCYLIGERTALKFTYKSISFILYRTRGEATLTVPTRTHPVLQPNSAIYIDFCDASNAIYPIYSNLIPSMALLSR